MRHHRKSNQGRFSKVQRQASRFMQANKFQLRDPLSPKARLAIEQAKKTVKTSKNGNAGKAKSTIRLKRALRTMVGRGS